MAEGRAQGLDRSVEKDPRGRRLAQLARRLRLGWVLAACVLLSTPAFIAARRSEETGTLRTAQVTVADLELTATALGKIRPREYVDVGAQVSGQLERVWVEVGDRVEQGQLLAEIDATVLQARVDAGRAQLEELQANLAEQSAQVRLARTQAERNRRLRADDAISEDAAQTSEAQLEMAQARRTGLEAQIERLRSTLEGDLANLSYAQIYAPIAGTVVSQSALAGQTLNANQTTPTILRIADLTQMTVSAEVSEADVTRLRPGMPVYFSTLGMPERRWSSSVRQVLPQPEIVNDVVLYKALLDVDNADGSLLPEMTAQVFFQLDAVADAITVPLPAIHESARRGAARGTERAGPWVLRLENGRAERRPVELGLRTRTAAQVLSGLEPGDTVVLGTLEPQSSDADAGSGDRNRFRGLRRML